MDALHTGGNVDVPESLTSDERALSDLLEAGGKEYGPDAAILEGVLLNRATIWKGDRPEPAAVHEAALANIDERVRECDSLQARLGVKGVAGNLCRAVWHLDELVEAVPRLWVNRRRRWLLRPAEEVTEHLGQTHCETAKATDQGGSSTEPPSKGVRQLHAML